MIIFGKQYNHGLPRKIICIDGKVKVKISLFQAVEAHRVVRG
jgi:hypothetical protein